MRTIALFILAVAMFMQVVFAPLPPPDLGAHNSGSYSDASNREHFVNSTIGQLFHHLPMPEIIAEKPLKGNVRHFPVLYWRLWADKPQDPFIAFLILMAVSNLVWFLLPKSLTGAAQALGRNFWSSFAHGLVALCGTLLAIRVLFMSVVGSPVSYFLIAAIETGFFLGVSISGLVMGRAILHKLNLLKSEEKNTAKERALYLACGMAILSLMLLIPELGEIPRLGTRLVSLYCILGMGALIHSKFHNNK